MIMNHIYLHFYKYTILFETDCQSVLSRMDWYKDYTVTNDADSYDLLFQYCNQEELVCEFDHSGIFRLSMPFKDIENSETIKTLLMVCVQWVLQRNNVFMIHASCGIDPEGNACAFWGNSGSGKTTINIEQCKRNQWQFYSNGSVLVEMKNQELNVVGTMKKNIKIRYSSYIQQDPERATALFKNVEGNIFDLKIVVEPEKIGLKHASGVFKLTRMYSIKLMNDCFYSQPLTYNNISLMLYRDTSRFLRGSDVYMLFGKENNRTLFMPSLDSNELHHKRVDFINLLYRTVLVSALHGTLANCSEFIRQKS